MPGPSPHLWAPLELSACGSTSEAPGHLLACEAPQDVVLSLAGCTVAVMFCSSSWVPMPLGPRWSVSSWESEPGWGSSARYQPGAAHPAQSRGR